MKKIPILGMLLASATFMAGHTAMTSSALAESSEPKPAATANMPETVLDRAGVEKIVREYLLANPEILLDVQTALETKQQEEQKLAQAQVLEEAKDQIFNSEFDGVAGNPDGKVTVVEFFDYNCGYCKRALADMEDLIAENDDIRFVLKEFPILGPDSREAHVVSMAVRAAAPEKYAQFHKALLGSEGRANKDSAIKAALDAGVDEKALRAEMLNPQTPQIFAQTYDLANKLSVTGTPAYVIGGEVVFGALGKDVLLEKVEKARESAKAATE